MELIRKLGTRINKNGNLESWGLFLCPDCLQEVEKQLSNGLKQKFCGCTKGQTKTKLYHCWEGVKQRVLNTNKNNYKNYGGRGITICNEWLEFIPFRDWALSNGYAEGLRINRIFNDGNYEPSNCEWITQKENNRKKGSNKIKNIEMADEIRYLHKIKKYKRKELAKKYKVSIFTINGIIYNNIWKKND